MGRTAPSARALASWLLLGCAAAVALAVEANASATDGPSTAETEDATARGGELYQRWCAVCHATDGSGTADGPPVDELSIALVDLTMRTGSMPLADPNRGVRERRFTDDEREAALAYMVEAFGLSGEVEEPGPGDPGRGQDLYTVHCAQCHGANGEGGVSGRDATVPRTRGVDPIVIAQAVREGPFQMPPFNEKLLRDDELDDIVAFLEDQPSNSPLGLADLTRVAAFTWALLLGTIVLVVCWWIGHRPVRAPDADLAGEREGKGSAS
ncbi:MAG TPA: c-type cytochrome [Egibacteraceae bacterium]|nr:c-type cytochrome [Egibacteraceae bacterium]